MLAVTFLAICVIGAFCVGIEPDTVVGLTSAGMLLGLLLSLVYSII